MSFKLKKGLNECTNEQYHSDKSYLSSSNLKLLLKDPAKFHHDIVLGKGVSEQKAIFDEGTYAHSLILEPENIEAEFSFFPGWRKAGKDWESFKQLHSGKVILSKPQKARVEKWVQAYRELPVAGSLIEGGYPEHTLVGELYGVPVKVRADYLNVTEGYLADVKTTSYPSDVDSFKLVIEDFSYDLSAALYTMLFEDYYKKIFDFYFIVLGKKDVNCEVFKASRMTMQKGKLQVIKALNIYKECLKTGLWKSSEDLSANSSAEYEILEV